MEVLSSLLAILLAVLIKGILHIIEFSIKNVALVCLTTFVVNLVWLCKMMLAPYVEPVMQLGEEEGGERVPQQREGSTTPVPQQREEEESAPVFEPRNQNYSVLHHNNVADAVSRINFTLSSEPGFIIDNEIQRRLRFEAISESGRAGFVAILDEFWGQFFDLQGKLTKKAKLIRLETLLGLDVQLGIEYSRYFNILMGPEFARPVQPSTLVMPNKINSAYSELRNMVINSFLYEERRNLDDDAIVKLTIRAHQQQNTSSNNVIQRNPVYEMVRPFIVTNPIWAYSLPEREAAVTIGFFSRNESKLLVLYSFSVWIRKLLSLDGSLYLFSHNYSYEETLISLLASRVQQLCWTDGWVPNCGQGCIWQGDLIVCFGGWCINRIFELLLVETRPEIWLMCTSLLNRLKGIIEPAFSVEQPPLIPCFCFNLLDSVAMGLELASSYETSRAQFKRKYTARNMAIEAYYIISWHSHANFESGDMVVIKLAADLMSVLQHYSDKLLLDF